MKASLQPFAALALTLTLAQPALAQPAAPAPEPAPKVPDGALVAAPALPDVRPGPNSLPLPNAPTSIRSHLNPPRARYR